MNTSQAVRIPEHLAVVLALARLLHRLERSTEPVSPDQYRVVVDRLAQALREAPVDDGLRAVLQLFPDTAQLYENLNYQHAGLCRSSLEASLAAELLAREAIGNAARVTGGSSHLHRRNP